MQMDEVLLLLRILHLAFDKISALYFTVKYFADDAIPISVIPRVCFIRTWQKKFPDYSFARANYYFARVIYYFARAE